MTALTKTFFSLTVIGFVAGGIIDFGGFSDNPFLMILFPLGAVFFGLTLISVVMQKEMATFDAEQAGSQQASEPGHAGTPIESARAELVPAIAELVPAIAE